MSRSQAKTIRFTCAVSLLAPLSKSFGAGPSPSAVHVGISTIQTVRTFTVCANSPGNHLDPVSGDPNLVTRNLKEENEKCWKKREVRIHPLGVVHFHVCWWEGMSPSASLTNI